MGEERVVIAWAITSLSKNPFFPPLGPVLAHVASIDSFSLLSRTLLAAQLLFPACKVLTTGSSVADARQCGCRQHGAYPSRRQGVFLVNCSPPRPRHNARTDF